jgi:Domain of unknown function (DUF4157)
MMAGGQHHAPVAGGSWSLPEPSSRSFAGSLPQPLRSTLEGSLQHSLLGVRVHPDATVPSGADAATAGHNVFFRRGQYRPDLAEGRELIAHEAVHVVQQQRGRVPGAGGLNAHASLEAEAERHGERAAQGLPAPILGAGLNAPGAVQFGRTKPRSRGGFHRQTSKPVRSEPEPDPIEGAILARRERHMNMRPQAEIEARKRAEEKRQADEWKARHEQQRIRDEDQFGLFD